METISTYFLYFVVYSVLGWTAETVYCSIPAHRFINRGFLNGPVCPVYGVGALLVLFLLRDFMDNILLVFVYGVLFTSILEYVTSWLMEKLFHHRWWDYSGKRYNLHGRVCLLNSLLFGVMAVVLVFVIHPAIRALFRHIPSLIQTTAAIVLAVYFAADLAVTLHSVVSLNIDLSRLNQLALSAGKPLRYRHNMFRRRLLAAFPHMRSLRYDERLIELKAHIRTYLQRRHIRNVRH